MDEQRDHDDQSANGPAAYGRPGAGDVTTLSQASDRAAERRSRASVLIPSGSFLQNRWKGRVLIAISAGMPIRAAIDEATIAEQEESPTFRPQHDAALFDLM